MHDERQLWGDRMRHMNRVKTNSCANNFFPTRNDRKHNVQKKTDRTEFRLHAKNHIFFCIPLSLSLSLSMALVALYYSYWMFEKHRMIESESLPPLIMQFTSPNANKKYYPCNSIIFTILVSEELCTYRFRWFESLQVPNHYVHLWSICMLESVLRAHIDM